MLLRDAWKCLTLKGNCARQDRRCTAGWAPSLGCVAEDSARRGSAHGSSRYRLSGTSRFSDAGCEPVAPTASPARGRRIVARGYCIAGAGPRLRWGGATASLGRGHDLSLVRSTAWLVRVYGIAGRAYGGCRSACATAPCPPADTVCLCAAVRTIQHTGILADWPVSWVRDRARRKTRRAGT